MMKPYRATFFIQISLLVLMTIVCYSQASDVTFSRVFRNVVVDFSINEKGGAEYFKFDETLPTVRTNLIQVSFEACTGRIAIYVKRCNPRQKKCDDSKKWVPSSSNYDYTAGEAEADRKYQLPLTQLCSKISNLDEGVCSSAYVYYVAVVSLQSSVTASVYMHTFNSGSSIDMYHTYTMDKALKIARLDDKSTKISWEPAKYCSLVDAGTFKCLEEEEGTNFTYRIAYAKADTKKNPATVCGRSQQIYTIIEESTNTTEFVLSSDDEDSYFSFSVLVEPNHPGPIPSFYTPLVLTSNGKVLHEKSNNGSNMKARRVIGSLFLAAFLITLIGSLITLIAAGGHWFYKRQQRKKEVTKVFLGNSF